MFLCILLVNPTVLLLGYCAMLIYPIETPVGYEIAHNTTAPYVTTTHAKFIIAPHLTRLVRMLFGYDLHWNAC